MAWQRWQVMATCVRHVQGPSQPGSPAGREAAGNGAHAGANPFATPNSAASRASFEDEETLLLDPQARPLSGHLGCIPGSLGVSIRQVY